MRKKLWILASLLIAVGIIGLAFNKFDFDDNGLVHFEKSWSVTSDQLNELIIDGNSSDVKIEFSESSSDLADVIISGKTEPLVVERIEGTEMTAQTLQLDLRRSKQFKLIQFNFTEPEIVVQVSLPKSSALDKLQVNTASGNTKVYGANVDELSIETRSGDIALGDVQATEASVISHSGYVKLENIASKLTTTTSSGDIKIRNLSGELAAESKSGYISVVQKEANSASVTTSSGDVKFTAAKDFAGSYDVSTKTGDIKMPEQIGTSQELIAIHTGSGSITIKQ